MKLVFLDIDGVLNNLTTCRGARCDEDCFDPELVKRLNRLTEMTGAHLVLSSSWRLLVGSAVQILEHAVEVGYQARSFPTPESLFVFLAERGIQAPFRGLTPLEIYDRGRAIEAYVEANGLLDSDFVILDDEYVPPFNHRLVQTSLKTGLTELHLHKAVALLGEP